jgi:hypothetical protein
MQGLPDRADQHVPHLRTCHDLRYQSCPVKPVPTLPLAAHLIVSDAPLFFDSPFHVIVTGRAAHDGTDAGSAQHTVPELDDARRPENPTCF